MVLSNCRINLVYIETSFHLLVRVNRLIFFWRRYKKFTKHFTRFYHTTQIRPAHAVSHPHCWWQKEWPRPYCNQAITPLLHCHIFLKILGEGNNLTLVQIYIYNISKLQKCTFVFTCFGLTEMMIGYTLLGQKWHKRYFGVVTPWSTVDNKFYTCTDVFCSLFQNICAKKDCQTAALQAMPTNLEERNVSI